MVSWVGGLVDGLWVLVYEAGWSGFCFLCFPVGVGGATGFFRCWLECSSGVAAGFVGNENPPLSKRRYWKWLDQ